MHLHNARGLNSGAKDILLRRLVVFCAYTIQVFQETGIQEGDTSVSKAEFLSVIIFHTLTFVQGPTLKPRDLDYILTSLVQLTV